MLTVAVGFVVVGTALLLWQPFRPVSFMGVEDFFFTLLVGALFYTIGIMLLLGVMVEGGILPLGYLVSLVTGCIGAFLVSRLAEVLHAWWRTYQSLIVPKDEEAT